jgi:hypothetical protein
VRRVTVLRSRKMNAPDRKKEKGEKEKKGAFREGGGWVSRGGGKKEIKAKRYALTLNPSARGREDTSFGDADRSVVEPFRSRLQYNTHAHAHAHARIRSLPHGRHMGHMDTS